MHNFDLHFRSSFSPIYICSWSPWCPPPPHFPAFLAWHPSCLETVHWPAYIHGWQVQGDCRGEPSTLSSSVQDTLICDSVLPATCMCFCDNVFCVSAWRSCSHALWQKVRWEALPMNFQRTARSNSWRRDAIASRGRSARMLSKCRRQEVVSS